MKFAKTGGFALVLVATTAFAHSGVQNAAVKERMDFMSAIARNLEVLGNMAKGKSVYDQTLAIAAARAIANEAGQTTALFEDPEMDPKSEAKPAIWENFNDFSQKVIEFEDVAENVAASINGIEDVKAGVASLAKSCGSCHQIYRK